MTYHLSELLPNLSTNCKPSCPRVLAKSYKSRFSAMAECIKYEFILAKT